MLDLIARMSASCGAQAPPLDPRLRKALAQEISCSTGEIGQIIDVAVSVDPIADGTVRASEANTRNLHETPPVD